MTTDPDGWIRDWNLAAESLFGWSASEAISQNITSLIIPTRFHEAHLSALRDGAKQVGNQNIGLMTNKIARHRDGHEFDVELSVSFQEIDGQQFCNAFIRDISNRKYREKVLLERSFRIDEILDGTIAMMSKTLEVRDPYTAGHQMRTAQLVTVISRELGWEGDRVRGLVLGAEIHDIGKVSLPAELLSKPGKLTELEFQMIMTHPQVGFDIVTSIDFPWPIANIVLQHHERLNGSGYPNGLSGDAICEEARILAVADVFEAMHSHRPYRPARGIECAWNAIMEGKGTLYDPNVVDACARAMAKGDMIRSLKMTS